ncbi:MAG: BMC domain-containing protein [Anaerolineales bacterium]|nr:BMC domain-containing protein [Anaerolineales bacterium]
MSYLSHEALLRGVQPSQPRITPIAGAEPSLALFEFTSIAQGMVAADAMLKRTHVDLLHAGTVQPGHYLVGVGGEVADVEEALKAGRDAGADSLRDVVWLPGVHPSVLHAFRPQSVPTEATALGIIETLTAPAAIKSADVAVKGASITLTSIRLSDGLGGKSLVLLMGAVSDVEAALELVRVQNLALVKAVVIPQLHAEFMAQVIGETRFFR